MEPDESPEEDGPLFAYLPPDDRLWRHPSELRTSPVPVAAPKAAPVRIWTVALLAGLVGALVASGVGVTVGEFGSRSTTVLSPVTRVAPPNTLAAASLSRGAGSGWPSIVDAVSPSVASVSTVSGTGVQSGSGLVYATDKQRTYLLTSAALVGQGGPITVVFNGTGPTRGHLMSADSKTGLALVWVDGSDRTAALLGSIGHLHEAEPVMAVGARPTGVAGTVSGSVSSLDRTVVDNNTSDALAGVVAISGTVPAGDAGGPVVDDQGTVIGIATAVTSANPEDSGLSFVVPIDVAMHVASQIMTYRRVTHPWLGVLDSTDLDSATAQRMGLSGGAEVLGVASGSPLAAARIQPHDVITGLDGRPVNSSGDLTAMVASMCSPGSVAAVKYRHAGQARTTTVQVAEQPADIDGS